MRKSAKISLIIAALLLVFGAVLCFGGLTLTHFDLNRLNDPSSLPVTREQVVSEPFTDLEIDGLSCAVRLRPSADGSCHIRLTTDRPLTLTDSLQGNTLTVKVEEEHSVRIHFPLRPDELLIELPQAQYGRLEIATASGEIEIPADFTFEKAKLDATSGSLSLMASVSGAAELHTSSGAIRIKNTQLGSLEAEAASGTITLENLTVKGNAELEATSGSIIMDGLTAQKLDAETTSGTIKAINVLLNEDMDLETASGSIRLSSCDAPRIELESSSGSISGTLRTGKLFSARSSSGSIRLPENSGSELCTVTTASGSIDLSVE